MTPDERLSKLRTGVAQLQPALDPRQLAGDVVTNSSELDRVGEFMRSHWIVIGVMAILGALAGAAAAVVMTKTYRSEVLLMPVSAESGSPLSSLADRYGGLAGMAGVNLGDNNGVTAAAVATLKSRSFLEQFISDRHLLPVLFAPLWDAAQKKWRVSNNKRPPSLQDGYDKFVKGILSVTEDKQTKLVSVLVEWRDPQQAAQWANELVAKMNEAAQSRAINNANRSIEYLQAELEHAQSVELRQSIYSLLQSQINKRMVANTRPDFAFGVIDPGQSSERDKYVRPIPLLLVVGGFFAGTFLGMLAGVLSPGLSLGLKRAKRT